MGNSVPRRRGAKVSVLVNDNGTCLVPGLVLGVLRGGRLEMLVSKSGGCERVSYPQGALSDFVGVPGKDLADVWEANGVYERLAREVLQLDALPPVTGDAKVTSPEDLVGRRVSFILHNNGTCVVGVRVLRVEPYVNELRVVYRLPDKAGDSKVPLNSIGHLHVFIDAPDGPRFKAGYYVGAEG